MRFDYYKNISRGITLASIITLSSLGAIAYQGEAFANANSGDHGGGAGNSDGRGARNSLGERSRLIKAENASDVAREHASHDSAVILAYPEHIEDGHTHNADPDD